MHTHTNQGVLIALRVVAGLTGIGSSPSTCRPLSSRLEVQELDVGEHPTMPGVLLWPHGHNLVWCFPGYCMVLLGVLHLIIKKASERRSTAHCFSNDSTKSLQKSEPPQVDRPHSPLNSQCRIGPLTGHIGPCPWLWTYHVTACSSARDILTLNWYFFCCVCLCQGVRHAV